jgi:hypothetical protein
MPMRPRAGKDDQFIFITDVSGQPVRARITYEALAQFIRPRHGRFQPRELRRIYIEHHDEIHRIAKVLRQERRDPDAPAIVITNADVLRLRSRWR